jgi:uncharacterized repeat protein (TIGR04076 family)
MPKKMVIEVVESKGKCTFGYKVGDKWETQGLKCIPGFCGAAFHCAFPALFALNFGAKFFFMDKAPTPQELEAHFVWLKKNQRAILGRYRTEPRHPWISGFPV